LIAGLAAGLAASAAAAQDAPRFVADLPDSSSAGHATLRWQDAELGPSESYQLEQAENADFEDARIVLDGRDSASFVSGLANGTYHYRVRIKPTEGPAGPWSAPHVLVVEHHSLGFSVALFGLGAVVFALTIGFVWLGGKRAQQEAQA
jgi:hypothetical protein